MGGGEGVGGGVGISTDSITGASSAPHLQSTAEGDSWPLITNQLPRFADPSNAI